MDSAPTAVPVGEYASLGRAQEHALVILAMNLSCWLGRARGEGYVLLAEPERAPAIAAELEEYDREQRGEERGVHLDELPQFRPGAWWSLLWAAGLMAVFLWQTESPALTSAGAADNLAMVEGGQWWRAFTALFLHGDLEHLGLNIIAGFAYSVMVCRSLGRALGWSLIFASGVLGNILTAWSYYPERHSSIGASTAVFGALGVITAYGFYLAFRSPASAPWRSVIVPLGGGLALLGLSGAGPDANIDVIAHLFGFVAGCALGFVASWWRLRPALRARV